MAIIEESRLFKHFTEIYSSSVVTFNIHLSQIIRKISGALHSIEDLLLLPKVELDELVTAREQKMNLEFARRFSRNNLYPIHLKLTKLENEIIVFKSDGCCRISRAVILRSLILSVISNLSRSTQTYEKYLKKSHLKCTIKLDDLISYLQITFQIIPYVVDTSLIETLDVSETVILILKLSKKLKCETFSRVTIIKNQCGKKVSRNTKVPTKFKRKQVNRSGLIYPIVMSKNGIASLNQRNTGSSLDSKPLTCSCYLKSATLLEKNSKSNANCNNVEKVEAIETKYSILQLQKIHSKLSNELFRELVLEVTNDMTECIFQLITNAYRRELVNTDRQ